MAGNRFTDLIPDDMDVKAKRKKPLTEKQKASLCKPKGEQRRKSYGDEALFDSLKAPILDPEARKAKSTRQYQKTKRQREAEAAPVVSETPDSPAPANVEVRNGKVWVPEMGREMSIEELQSQLNVLKKSQVVAKARDDFLTFIQYMFPDHEDPDNPAKTSFEVSAHHRLIAEKLEAVERGDCKRLIITIRPRAGKSEMVSRMFSAWFLGKQLRSQIIAAGYNYDFAVDEIGSKVLPILKSERYREVFPEFELAADKKSAGIMRNTKGGQLAISGVGGSLTGRGANLLIIEDIYKNWEEAESARYRDTTYNWYTSTAKTRLMKNGRVILVFTRWHEDDLIGRLIDPTNKYYKEAIAKGFEVLEIPDVAGDGVDIKKDPLGRKPGEVLWPEWFPDDALEMKMQDERVYYALYQGQPRPPGGVFFKEEHIQTYGNHERPSLQDLTIYGSCDLSASPERDNDSSVFITAGMDRAGVLWILDIWWEHLASDDAVDYILTECARYQPVTVWWESGPITKTITPFLERQKKEMRQYTYFETYPATANKAARARGIRGMMASGMVRFPRDHEKFGDLKNQILKFTGSGKDNDDDAVDALSGFGMMLTRQTNYTREQTEQAEQPRNVITLDWIKRSSREQERRERLRKARRGM
ncbi:hypothetical protein DFO67_13212 [Modicisalibacter xianhensis]|uniref:Terminase large subunit gp17-like C-terminal domain-containing protein n=1 Tax=Modicisalibacter xianhensis TaxID=442341 RepID=A0A4V3GS87_9GAMM|nr:terminase family protein [Halomonas xianhensis]TDX21893.1 hypothetical protein DFO67_13212 [Halomonas xianhensis]